MRRYGLAAPAAIWVAVIYASAERRCYLSAPWPLMQPAAPSFAPASRQCQPQADKLAIWESCYSTTLLVLSVELERCTHTCAQQRCTTPRHPGTAAAGKASVQMFCCRLQPPPPPQSPKHCAHDTTHSCYIHDAHVCPGRSFNQTHMRKVNMSMSAHLEGFLH
jgi:hypothetical protein